MARTRMLAGTAVASLALIPGMSAMAQEQDHRWHGEITPYLWAAGIDDSVTVAGQQADVNVAFNDLLDKTNVGGSIFSAFQKNRLVFSGQIDYLDLSTDKITGPAGGTGHIDSTASVGTLAVGYQFDGLGSGTVDLLVGARQLALDNKLTVDGIGTFKKDLTFTDTVLVVRPHITLSERWHFNPTLSYGSGDSKYTWEVWSRFQYMMGKTWQAFVGYRRLYYNLENDNLNKFDGVMHGFTLGLGYQF